jgi:hypothetical protein
MSLHDNGLEEQREKAGQQPAEPDQGQKANYREQILAADLKAWEPLKAELIQEIEKELRPKWEAQLYKQRQTGASGFDLTLGGRVFGKSAAAIDQSHGGFGDSAPPQGGRGEVLESEGRGKENAESGS